MRLNPSPALPNRTLLQQNAAISCLWKNDIIRRITASTKLLFRYSILT